MSNKDWANEPIIWTGDLSDDCTALWAGLMLRAEWMDKSYWWWEVSDMQKRGVTVDSANNYDGHFKGGAKARKCAEEAARKYISIHGGQRTKKWWKFWL